MPLPLAEHMEVRWVDLQHAQMTVSTGHQEEGSTPILLHSISSQQRAEQEKHLQDIGRTTPLFATQLSLMRVTKRTCGGCRTQEHGQHPYRQQCQQTPRMDPDLARIQALEDTLSGY